MGLSVFFYLSGMKYNLLSLFFILFISSFNYAQETLPQPESNKLYLKGGGVVVTNGIIFSSGRNVFFYVNEKDICKIQLSEIKNSDRFKKYEELPLSESLITFSNKAKSGIVTSLLGSAVSVVSLFIVEEPVAAIAISSVGSGISIIGFMVWASSYKYLKYAGVMMQAKPYETYLKELQENF